MFLRRLKHMLLRLSIEEKVIGIGSIVVILGTFMPWYTTVVLNLDKGMTESGFSGDLGVIGFVAFLFMLMSLGFLMADHLNVRLPRFGFQKESIMLFLNGESAFLLLLVVAVFTKRSLEFTNAEIRFGLYTALIGAVLATFASFALIQKRLKKEAKAFFGQKEQAEEVQEELPQEEEPPVKEHQAKRQIERQSEPIRINREPESQERFFPEMNDSTEEAVEETPIEETTMETEVEETLVLAPETAVEEEVNPRAQGNFFMRDADLSPVAEPTAEPEKKEPAPSPSRDMGFYNDL